MRVLAHVLCKIDDHRYINEQIEESEAVAQLVQAYTRYATQPRHGVGVELLPVTDTTYGSDFKQWLTQLPIQDRWRMIDRYLAYFPQYAEGDARNERGPREPDAPRESEDVKEHRKLKIFAIRLSLILLFFVMVLVVAAGVSLMSTKHLLPDNAVLKVIMETAAELAKILFTLK